MKQHIILKKTQTKRTEHNKIQMKTKTKDKINK